MLADARSNGEDERGIICGGTIGPLVRQKQCQNSMVRFGQGDQTWHLKRFKYRRPLKRRRMHFELTIHFQTPQRWSFLLS